MAKRKSTSDTTRAATTAPTPATGEATGHTMTRTITAPSVNMQDIADRCGVSLITVSRTLRKDPRVKEATAQRIMRVAHELGYDPAFHQAARRMAMRRHGLETINHVIGVFLAGDALKNNYFAEIFHGILSQATSQGFALLTADLQHNQQSSELLPIYTRGEVDGFIFQGWTYSDIQPYLTQLGATASSPSPTLVALLAPVDGCSAVLTDDRAGAYAATRHLLALGHRHILHFWDDKRLSFSHFVRERAAGIRQAYLEQGLDADQFVRATATTGMIPLGHRIVKPLTEALEQYPEVTAVLLPSDYFAAQAREVLEQRGLRIPEDISLIGFDDTDPLLDGYGHNILTTVHLPLEDVGRQTAQLLIDHVLGKEPVERQIVLPSSLTIRSSTAPPKR